MKKRFSFTRKKKDIFIDIVIFGFAGMVLLVAGILIWLATLKIPDLSAFEERRVLQSTRIYDRTGEILLYDLHEDIRRTEVPFENISPYIKKATIAIEDSSFYEHFGVNPRAIVRAAISNVQEGELGQGGSTITQQVIKNSVLQREKTFTRKAKEAILALKLEQIKTKDEILSIYLNESPYGGTIYGVEEAARAFFKTSAADVTLAQAAYLAALPQAPTFLSPYGNNRDRLDARQELVLQRMLTLGHITQEEHDAAVAEEVQFEPNVVSGIRAPHFVMYIREQLAEKFGEEALAERGLRVITTLDYELQEAAEEIVARRVEENTPRFNASNAGLVATDPKTGDVLVMVGSRDYFSEEIDGNFNVALTRRQPGSAIKPFVYAAAFKKGYLPNTTLFDVRTQFSTSCEPFDFSPEPPCYAPNNHNNQFVGPISMKNALAQSLNIPAVKTLYLVGIPDALKLAADLGLTTLNNPDRYGLTLVLGGGEVRLLDMTHAYGVFANRGIKAEPRSILRIEDRQGNIIEENQVKESRVLDANIADMINDILSDNAARAPLWGWNNQLNFENHEVAGKSGSTNNFRDAWILGHSTSLAVGAWSGNNDNSPMRGLSGLITTPMWRDFMDIALEKYPGSNFTQPSIPTDVKPVIAGNYLNVGSLLEVARFATSTEAQAQVLEIANNINSILHYVDRNNPRGPAPTNPGNDGQYRYWQYGVRNWVEQTFNAALGIATTTPSETEEGEEEATDTDPSTTPETDSN